MIKVLIGKFKPAHAKELVPAASEPASCVDIQGEHGTRGKSHGQRAGDQRRRERWIDRVGRKELFRRLALICSDQLVVIDGAKTFQFGNQKCQPVVVTIHDPRFFGDLASQGTIAAGETFIKGYWSTNDLVGLIRLILRHQDTLAPARDWWGSHLHHAVHRLRRNTLSMSKKNIADHYDLGNEFFRTFLDETMMYSSAYFDSPETDLGTASREKVDRLCRRLDLRPEHHLLEIGTGWGYLACHAAKHFGCRVTTTTISNEQFREACKQVADHGLADRVRVLCQDYRHLEGEFDRLISVEMIEAVGHEYLDLFLSRCSRLLRPTGAMALQAITIPDEYLATYRQTVDFIQRFIFPGGALPSIGQIIGSAARGTDLRLVYSEDLASHYARTLREWRHRFHANVDAIRSQGFDHSFIRRWEYYFCYCEAGFRERTIGLSHLIFEKPRFVDG